MALSPIPSSKKVIKWKKFKKNKKNFKKCVRNRQLMCLYSIGYEKAVYFNHCRTGSTSNYQQKNNKVHLHTITSTRESINPGSVVIRVNGDNSRLPILPYLQEGLPCPP